VIPLIAAIVLSSPIEKLRVNDLDVFVYKPPNFTSRRMLIVCHGTLRNADEYCADAKILANRFGILIVAPKFDKERFPNWRYHRGGILDENGMPREPKQWTYEMIPPIVEHFRKLYGKDLNYAMIGHSAGGQFVNRYAATGQSGASAMIVSNPSTVVFPTNKVNYPYGMGGVPGITLRSYLAQPIWFYMGESDNVPDEDLDVSIEANKQGYARLQRSSACYEQGKVIAEQLKLPFNWKLLTVPKIGHDHTKMFNSPIISKIFEDF
jgi:pimeloyl-ACP methyl ester carboxylesterase